MKYFITLLNDLINKYSTPIELSYMWRQKQSDCGHNLLRIHGSLIRSENNPDGLFSSEDVVTVRNLETGRFTTLFVKGHGSQYKGFYKNSIALDLRSMNALGIPKDAKEVRIAVQRGNMFSRHFGRMYVFGTPEERLGWQNKLFLSYLSCIASGFMGWIISNALS